VRKKAIRSVFYLILFFPAILPAQEPFFKSFNVQDGLASLEIYKTFIDSKGFIWFATENGVSLYNGSTFTNYSTQHGLADNVIIDIQEDRRGRIWIIPITGYPSYYKDGRIKSVKFTSGKQGTASGVLEAPDGRIYFTTYEGVCELRGDSLVLRNEVRPGNFMGIGRTGTAWANSSFTVRMSNDFFKTTFLFTGFPETHTLLPLSTTKSFDAWKDVYAIENQKLKILDTAMHRLYLHIAEVFGKSKMKVASLQKDTAGVWLGTYNDGLFFYDRNYLTNKRSRHYFFNTVVSYTARDFEGNLWVSTIGDGVFMIPSESYYTIPAPPGVNKNINALSSSGNTLWVGRYNEIVEEFRGGRFITHDLKKLPNQAELTKGRITRIAPLEKDLVFVGSDGGAYLYRKNKWEKFPVGSVKYISKPTRAGDILVTSRGMGYRIQKDGSFCDTIAGFKTIYPARLYFISEDPKGGIWVGSERGLYYGIYSEYLKRYVLWKALEIQFFCMEQLPDSTLILGSKHSGVYICSNGKVSILNSRNGLDGDICKSLKIKGQDVWVLTDKGISRIRIRDSKKHLLEVRKYAILKNFFSGNITDIQPMGDSLWIGTLNGLYLISNIAQSSDPASPRLYISSVTADGHDMPLKGSYVFEPGLSSIRFDFIGLSYISSGNMLYRFKLHGLDTSWSYTRYPMARFTSLPGGAYKFVVEAQNSLGAWTRSPKSISFTIKKAFWETWIFRLAAGALLITLLWTVISYMVFRRKKREMETLELKRKVAETELKALRSQMNPHFIFNCMNAILNIISKKDFESAYLYLSKFSTLMRTILENSNKKWIPIEEEVNTLKLYMDLEMLRFKNKFEYRIEIDPGIDIAEDCIPTMIIQPYVENAIWHGLLHKEGKGDILVRFKKEEEQILCTIEDNGIGIMRSGEIKKEKFKTHNSLGMQITRDRLDLINAQQHQQSVITVTDLLRSGEPCGTRIEILFPCYTI
jgi:ligand-binding sensor domain-containing protein